MKMTDEQLITELRSELDELTSGARGAPGHPPPAHSSLAPASGERVRRRVAISIAAAAVAALVAGLVIVANRDTGDVRSDTPPVTSASVPATAPAGTPAKDPETTAPGPVATTVLPGAATSAPSEPGSVADVSYEVVAPVLETAERGTQLCLGQWMIAATPPQCDGPELDGWSWDFVGGGNPAGTGTWAEAYLAGTWDAARRAFVVSSGRVPTAADRGRLEPRKPDFSVPCAEPVGGWSAPIEKWPDDQIQTIAGYAGSWEDPTHRVMTVKFTGDLEAAEAAVRQYYAGNLCVAPAQHDEEQLKAISNQLLSMSSVKWLWATVQADATGEWVDVGSITPDPERQAAFDAQYGEGVVRITSRLRPT
jgi:hypothetical protein